MQASRIVTIAPLLAAFLSCSAFCETVKRPSANSDEINTILMHSTFKISGKAKAPATGMSFGTVFIMGLPHKDDPKTANIVLITAAHVLEGIEGDEATLLVRRNNNDGTYTSYPYNIKIRTGNQPLYMKHPDADVAAMYADLPDDVPMTGLSPEFLLDDKRIDDIDLHPGDEAFVLGFPLYVGSPGEFPILRTAHLASYPLTPMKKVGKYYFDIFLYGGNSGGPVYFSYNNRTIKGIISFSIQRGIIGLVTEDIRSSLPEFRDKPLNFGRIIPSVFIRETLDQLPPKN